MSHDVNSGVQKENEGERRGHERRMSASVASVEQGRISFNTVSCHSSAVRHDQFLIGNRKRYLSWFVWPDVPCIRGLWQRPDHRNDGATAPAGRCILSRAKRLRIVDNDGTAVRATSAATGGASTAQGALPPPYSRASSTDRVSTTE